MDFITVKCLNLRDFFIEGLIQLCFCFLYDKYDEMCHQNDCMYMVDVTFLFNIMAVLFLLFVVDLIDLDFYQYYRLSSCCCFEFYFSIIHYKYKSCDRVFKRGFM